MRSILALIPLLAVSCILTGCASVAARTQDRAERVYPGVRDDVYYLAYPSQASYPFLQWLNIFDLPFSLCLDTVCLPVDICRANNPSPQLPPEY